MPHQVLRPTCRLAQPSCEPVLMLASPQVSRTHTNDGALPSPDGQPGWYMIQHEPTGDPGAAMRVGVAGGVAGDGSPGDGPIGGIVGGGGDDDGVDGGNGGGNSGAAGSGGEGGGGDGVPNTLT